jgi:glycosyltransferase involved in cell wall biosynthesis
LRVVDVSDCVGLNHTRNAGVSHAAGDFVAFCDGDDAVEPGWLDALVSAAGDVDIVAGPVMTRDAASVDGDYALPIKHDFLPAVAGGNCGMWVEVARSLPWDESFVYAGSDIEWSWRALLANRTIATAPQAVVRVGRDATVGALARRWYHYGASGGLLFRLFRDRGMPRSSLRRAARTWAWLLVHVPDLARDRDARERWIRTASYRTGRLAGSIRHRVAFP